MGCGKRICQECATQWEGIHYCRGCLSERRAEASKRTSAIVWLALLGAIVALFVTSTMLMIWTGVLMAGIL